MTRIFDDPAEFTADAVEGFTDLYESFATSIGFIAYAKRYREHRYVQGGPSDPTLGAPATTETVGA